MDLRKCTCMYISDILKISEPGRSLIYELSIPIRQEMENSVLGSWFSFFA